jgi:hypothetical protein
MSVASDTFAIARRYSDTFVETGTHKGLGLLGATYARFERMFTCEISRTFQNEAEANMGHQFGKIRYYLGSSENRLPQMLDDAGDVACAILLDAHVVQGDQESEEAAAHAGKACPLREELAALALAKRRDHLVMIDDIDLCGTSHLAWIGLEEVKRRLLDINPGYTFRLLGGVRPAMLLMACPPHFNP